MRTYAIDINKADEAYEVFRELRYSPFMSRLGNDTKVFGVKCGILTHLYFKFCMWRISRG